MAENTVAKEALKKVEDQLDCAICLQPYTDAKLLLCFHVFCKHCLEQIVKRNRDGSAITCPKCRRLTTLPQNSVAALQSAFHIAHLFDIRDTLEKAKHTPCEKCEKATATGYCRDCGTFVCDKCIEIHQFWKEFTHHQIVSLSEVQEEASSLVSPKKKVLYCSKHPDNALKIYCETCKEIICTDCTIRLHQGHQYDLVTDTFPKHQEELRVQLQPVREQLDTVNTALQALDMRTKEIEDKRIAVEEDIHRQIDQLHQALDRRRGELIGMLNAMTQQKLKSLAAQRDQTEMFQAQLTSCLEYVEGSLTTSTPAEILALKDSAIKQIQGMTANFNPDSLAPKEQSNMKFTADNLQQQCFQYGDVYGYEVDHTQCQVSGSKMATVDEQASLALQTVDKQGKEVPIPIKDITAELVHCTNQTTAQCEVKSKGQGMYTVTYTPTSRGRYQLHINVGQHPIGCSPLLVAVRLPVQKLGKTHEILAGLNSPRGVVVNSRGQILVSERDYISVRTPEGGRLQTFSKIKSPWGICLDRDNNILVTSNSGHQLHKYSPSGELIQSVGTHGNGPLQFYTPNGIAYNKKSGKIYVGEHGNHRVQILNEDLSFSSAFGTRGSGNGQLVNPWSLVLDASGNVYVVDYGNNRVQAYTAEGRFLRAFGSKGSGPGQLNQPTDVHVDGTGTVYVTEWSNHCVSVFTAKGQFLTSFGHEELSSPFGITVDDDGLVIVSDNKGHLCVF